MKKPPAAALALAVGGALLVLLLLLWVSFTGPGPLATGEAPARPTATSAGESSSAQPTQEATPRPQEPQQSGPTGLPSWIKDLLAILAVLAVGWALSAVLPRVLRPLGSRSKEPPDVELDPPAEEELGQRLVSAREEHLARLEEGTPRNGIVRCWMALEETATDLGVAPRPTETATEFLVRMLRNLDVDPRPAARLAELYHVARFSSHELTEADRGAARAALVDLHAELGVRPPGQPEGERE